MLNTNNNVQMPITPKKNNISTGTFGSTTPKTGNKDFNNIIEELQQSQELTEDEVVEETDSNNSLFKGAVGSGNVYGGQKTDRGTKIVQPGEDMDKDAFLKILAAQMSNQDPTQPQDGTEYVSQFAQFAAMEQMANLNDTMSEYSAQSLISRGVMLSSYDSKGMPITGVVRSVSQNGSDIVVGIEYINENGEFVMGEFEKDDITNVIDVPDSRLDYINNNMAMLVGSSMLDKEVEFIIANDEINEGIGDNSDLKNDNTSIDDNTIESENISSNSSVETKNVQVLDDSIPNPADLTPEERELLNMNTTQIGSTTYETRIGKVESVVVENYMIKLKVFSEETGELETITLDKIIRVNGEKYTS